MGPLHQHQRRQRTMVGLAVLMAALALAACDLFAVSTPTRTRTLIPLATLTPTPLPATATLRPATATSTRQPTALPTATVTPTRQAERVIRYVSADGDGLFIRSKPDMGAKVRVWPDGTAVEVLSQGGEWCQVRAPDGYVGYMPTRYLSDRPAGPTPTPTWRPAAATIMYVAADGDGLFIRSKPDMDARVKLWPDGTKVTILGQEGEWCHVRDPDGYSGFMPAKYLARTWP